MIVTKQVIYILKWSFIWANKILPYLKNDYDDRCMISGYKLTVTNKYEDLIDKFLKSINLKDMLNF